MMQALKGSRAEDYKSYNSDWILTMKWEHRPTLGTFVIVMNHNMCKSTKINKYQCTKL